MTRIFAFLTGLFLIATAFLATAQELHAPQCLGPCPHDRVSAQADATTIIIRDGYTVDADPMSKLARWVAYRVTPATMESGRPRNWAADPILKESATLEPEDYQGAYAALGLDHGHLAPLASLGAVADWESLNYLSNIAPQRSGLNRGPWQKLEHAERQLARSGTAPAVYVYTGPLFERPMKPLPGADERHRVPSGFWKIISIATPDGIERAAFIFDQDSPRSMAFCKAEVPLTEVEQRSGLSFAPKSGSIVFLSIPRDLGRRLGCPH